MKLKGLLCSVLIVALLGSLVGCGKEPAPTTTEKTTTEQTETKKEEVKKEEEKPAPPKMETVTVWTNSGHTKDFFNKLVDEYNATIGVEKGIKIEYKVNGGDHKKLLDMALANNQAPDIFKAVGPLTSFVKNKTVYPLDEIPGSEEFLAKYDGFLRKGQEIIGDHVYCVPYNTNVTGLIYNKDMFKAAGIVDANGEARPPKTWGELVDNAKQLTNPAEKQYGIVYPLKFKGVFDWFGMYPAVASTGHLYFDVKEGKYDFTRLTPVFEHILQIRDDNSFFPGAEGLSYDPARAQFAEGRIGMIFAASWDVGVLVDQFPAKCDWGVAPIPVLDENDAYKQFSNMASFIQINSTVADDRLEKVFEVYKWFNSDEVLISLYEESKFFPYNPELVDRAQNKPTNENWIAFKDLLPISQHISKAPPIKLEGPTYKEMLLKAWANQENLEDVMKDLDQRYNEALQKGIDDGSIDMDLYQVPDWNIKR